MNTYVSGKIDLNILALEPIHHGAGSEGNEQILRTQPVIVNGESFDVPFISGNAVKNMIRRYGVMFCVGVLGIDQQLTKEQVDLLCSGGQLSKKGTVQNLKQARELETLMPILGICGYAAANTMQSSKLSVSHWHLVCQENQFRLPDFCQNMQERNLSAYDFRADEFGTKHDIAGNATLAKMLSCDDTRLLASISEKRQKRSIAKLSQKDLFFESVSELQEESQALTYQEKKKTTQMIYSFGVIKPGSRLFGTISYTQLTPMELLAFTAALSTACLNKLGCKYLYKIGAKSAVGFGTVAIEFSGSKLTPIAPTYENESVAFDSLNPYIKHLADNRQRIIDILGEVTTGKNGGSDDSD